MQDSIKKNYFSIVKLIYMLILIVYFISQSNKNVRLIGIELLMLSGILACIVINELKENKYKALLIIEVVLLVLLIKYFDNIFIFMLPVIILEIVISLKNRAILYLLSYIGFFYLKNNYFNYFLVSSFTIIIYFQNYVIINKYERYVDEYINEEYKLKQSIDNKDLVLKRELEENSIYFENKMLEEKSRIYQSLHDKLGHSINGSLYQLEACKVLINKEPEKSINIVQGVIDALRVSMDEIRMILRKDKPSKKRMALLQLMGLCDECKNKYGIQAEVNIEGEDNEVPEKVWDVILDNSIEAVSNALKYSKCSKILINIAILNKLVRCNINDNGIGCENIEDGMGIQGMKRRARKINGIVDIEGNCGFNINMIFPLS